MKYPWLLAIVVSVTIAYAQEASKPTIPSQKPATEMEAWQNEQTYFQSLHEKDLKRFMSLWDANFVGWPDYREHPIKKTDMELVVREEFKTVHSGNSAFVAPTPEATGIFNDVAITYYFWPESDKTSEIKYRISHTWQKGPQGWHIIGGIDCAVPPSVQSGLPAAATASNLPVASSQSDDERAVEATVRGEEDAIQKFDFARADSYLTQNAKWIERSPPEPAAYDGTGFFAKAKATNVRLTNEPHDFAIHVQDNVAWVTLLVDVTTVADNAAARQLLEQAELEETGKVSPAEQQEWRATYVESEVLTKTPGGWKIALAHTSRLPTSNGPSPSAPLGSADGSTDKH